MKIIILGSGAREHALAWKLSREIGLENIFIAPGNGGTKLCGTNVDIGITNFEKLKTFCLDNDVNIVLPGSEDAIANGVRDYFESDELLKGVYVFSPDKHAGQMESSKSFAKEFMQKQGIPTAAYKKFTEDTVTEGIAFLKSLNPPYVLKADGLAAGKGVVILHDLKEAEEELVSMLNGKFGNAGATVVIEEFLDGIEFSLFALTDGEKYVILPEAKDYKRIGEGDTGLNTGGMGAVSPVPFYDHILQEKIISQIVEPTLQGFKTQNLNYRGFIFFGLIVCEGNNPFVIEYNARMGDPETEVVIPRIRESLSDMIISARDSTLTTRTAEVLSQYCTTVFAVSEGYPGNYPKDRQIDIASSSDMIFHAGSKQAVIDGKEQLITSGGRVLAATCLGDSLQATLDASYELVRSGMSFEGKTIRTDIGQDLMKYI